MFNLRETREVSVSTTFTTTTSSSPTPMTIILHTLTSIEDVDGVAICGSLNHRGSRLCDATLCGHDESRAPGFAFQVDTEVVSVADRSKGKVHIGTV